MPFLAVAPRELLLEGYVVVDGLRLSAFLFSDYILLCKQKREKSMEFHKLIYLPCCRVSLG